MTYKKRSAWRRGHWDKWGFWRKARHCISVFLSGVVSLAMLTVFTYFVLIVFGFQGFLFKLRDTILLDIMHSIFG